MSPEDAPGGLAKGDGYEGQTGDEQGVCQTECRRDGLADAGGSMVLHTMEPADGSTRSSGIRGASRPRGDSPGHRHDDRGGERGHREALLLGEDSGGGAPSRVGGVHTRTRYSGQGPSALGPGPSLQWASSAWSKDSTGSSGPLGPSGDHQERDKLSHQAHQSSSVLGPPSHFLDAPSAHPVPAACQVLLRSILLNRDATACYMNASILAVPAILVCPVYLPPPPWLAHPAAATAGGPLRLFADEPHRQHDMHEFLLHLIPRLRLPAVGGVGSSADWKRRV